MDPLCHGPFPKNFESMEKTLRELRSNRFGKSPNTAEEIKKAFESVNVMNGLGRSLYGKKHALFNHIQIRKNFSNCIFSSESSIALVKKYLEPEERFFVMDGTFRITPHGIYKQVLVLYVRFELKVRYLL